MHAITRSEPFLLALVFLALLAVPTVGLLAQGIAG